MIEIKDKMNCCGCTACVQKCPKQCISLFTDDEGFVYPKVDENKCVDCGLCEKVCPVINQNESQNPLSVYAAKNENEEIRIKSSSGGIFTLLAEKILEENGVVFGAKFNDNWEVVHDYTETIEGLAAFRGSKYIQSKIGDCYKRAEAFLKQGRQVLFSGTPCQIRGLFLFLNKKYENLTTVDVACHGVPSPLVWQQYIASIGGNDIPVSVTFRDKSTGWKSYSTKYTFQNKKINQESSKDIYMKGFLKDLYLRPSCYNCPSKIGKSGSDMTIGDFWGIQNIIPTFDDDKGVSVVFVNTIKGQDLYSKITCINNSVSYDDAVSWNPSLKNSASIPKYRHLFWSRFKTNEISAIYYVCNKMKPTLLHRIINKINGILS